MPDWRVKAGGPVDSGAGGGFAGRAFSDMKKPTRSHRPPASPPVAAAAIAAMSVALAAGLGALGLLDRLEIAAAKLVAGGRAAHFTKNLPDWVPWLAAVALACGLAFAMLHVTGWWRRLAIWLTALALVAGWAPVLALASRPPEIGAPLVAAAWAGICALIYAANYRLPDDRPAEPDIPISPDETR